MANSQQSWIGFFDLLGTRDSARIRRTDYPSKIHRFNTVLEEQAKHAKANVKLRFFSDSAYIECDNARELLEFARRVRWILFAEEVFFKAAIKEGNLADRVHKFSSKGSLKIDISGTSFGESVVDVYYAQESFKGIGFCLEGTWPQSAHSLLVASCFPGATNSKAWTSIRDIAFSESEIGGLLENTGHEDKKTEQVAAFFDNLLSAALRANTTKRNLARYYMSCFITVIRSSDFSKIEMTEKAWTKKPIIFSHMFEDKKRRDGYLSISGADCLFLAATNEIFSAESKLKIPKFKDGEQNEVCDNIVRMLLRYGILKGPLPSLPPYILSHEIAEDIARRMVRSKMP